VLAGELTTGDVVIFFAYVTSFYGPMKAIARSSNTFNRASVGWERIAEVLSVRSEVTDRPGARSAPRLRGNIIFQNVSFEYVAGHPVLSDVTLNIAPGEKVAIVGATGAGKSTLVGLVPRFYDPSHGAVCIDGNDIRGYTLQSLREQISLVLQESLLFSGSILENIAFSSPEATDEQILAAAIAANADEFIQRLPDGYQTVISERGTTLSGGQKQRVAIARAILRDASILILDEPTSGLDASSERLVMEALECVSAGRTTLMIAHRLTTVRLADRIVVLDRGRLVEAGTLEELMACNGRFARLYRLQALPESEDALT
jgi:ABC-type multidrug transport system fused ATPase/permease subunit